MFLNTKIHNELLCNQIKYFSNSFLLASSIIWLKLIKPFDDKDYKIPLVFEIPWISGQSSSIYTKPNFF